MHTHNILYTCHGLSQKYVDRGNKDYFIANNL